MKLITFIIGTLLLNVMFWNESLGLNFLFLVLFSLFANVQLMLETIKTGRGILVILGALIASSMVVVHGSFISIFSALISFIILIGYLHFNTIKTSFTSFLAALVNFVKIRPFIYSTNKLTETELKKKLRRVRIISLPIILVFIFGVIFYNANAFFRSAIDPFLVGIESFFVFLFGQFNEERITFFIFCIFLSSWIVYKGEYLFFARYDETKSDTIVRSTDRNRMKSLLFSVIGQRKMLGLKNEYTAALLTICAICVLLFIINCIDIVTIWFGNYSDPTKSYSEMVHEGVNLLILSILLSMVIILYVFRKNQHFYVKSPRLIFWTKVWIIQNGILIISVVIRNWYYISHQGLTHKRIGVYLFLVIVLLGLISLFIKISSKKSFFYLTKFNSWSMYSVLVFMACFNWDVLIAKFNIYHKERIPLDMYYITSMSDNSFVYIWNHRSQLRKEWKHNKLYMRNFDEILARRIRNIQNDSTYQSNSIWSWNFKRKQIQACMK